MPERKELPAEETVALYKKAADIANRALKHVLEQVKVGVKVSELCKAGNDFIIQACQEVDPENTMETKGIAFPTCVSVNNIVGMNAPLPGDDGDVAIQLRDVVKVDLGVELEGLPVCVAHTIVVGNLKNKAADPILAAYNAAQVAARLLKPGNTNSQITNAIAAICNDFGVKPVQGVLSHNVEQYSIDGPQIIANYHDPTHPAPKLAFEANQAYHIDIVVSSGEGKSRVSDNRANVYKRDPTNDTPVRVQSARDVINEVDAHCPVFPFSVAQLKNPNARFGLAGCVRSNHIQQYPVMCERSGEIVAQFKFTALILPTGTEIISGLLPLEEKITSEKAVSSEEYKALLAQSL